MLAVIFGEKNKMNRINTFIDKKFKILRKNHPLREGGRKNCKMEFAHIQLTKISGRGRGKNARYYDIIKNPNSYMLLTKKTHIYLDKIYGEN